MDKHEEFEIRHMFKGYRKVSTRMIKVLNSYGLTVQNSKKHLKIFRKDGVGPTVYIAHTPSDGRAWSNSVYYIIRLIEAKE